MSVRIGVFASGGGSNLQAVLDHFVGPRAEIARVTLVISDQAGAGALERARAAGIEAKVVPVAGRAAPEVAESTLEVLRDARIDLVVLAGYLRLVPAEVVRTYRERMLNIHPALLPAFGGKGMYGIRVHQAVLATGCRVSGATVHYVDERYDTGPILLQWPVPVLAGDSPEALAARVLRVEHRIYPLAIEAVARRLIRGEAVAGPLVADPVAFTLAEAAAPPAEDVRRVLGLA